MALHLHSPLSPAGCLPRLTSASRWAPKLLMKLETTIPRAPGLYLLPDSFLYSDEVQPPLCENMEVKRLVVCALLRRHRCWETPPRPAGQGGTISADPQAAAKLQDLPTPVLH